MRRHEREVTDGDRIREIIQSCGCCRLGFRDEGKIYIVPVNFGYTEENGRQIFYFHGAKAGRKADLIRKTGYAAFELDANMEIIGDPDGQACSYTAHYQSVTGDGSICFVEDPKEKKKALELIMRQNAGEKTWGFPGEMLDATGVIKLIVGELGCKENI